MYISQEIQRSAKLKLFEKATILIFELPDSAVVQPFKQNDVRVMYGDTIDWYIN